MTQDQDTSSGDIYRVSGPVVVAENLSARMNDVVRVGDENLLGEVIQIQGNKTFIQVYEETSGVKPGEPVTNTGTSLSVTLGPGLLTSIYDGLQRPLPEIQEESGDFIARGITTTAIDTEKKWAFTPRVKKGDTVSPGDVIGTVKEGSITHKILVPPHAEGEIVESVRKGEYTVEEPITALEDGTELKLAHEWPIREARPYMEKLRPEVPLITGQRILDGLFPLAKGGVAAIPGGFGTGKTVTQQQLAKWSDADVIVYIGCGERGNEMTEVLEEFPELEDPWAEDDRKLMERTVLIANTSNMPVAAREASIYTGITIAEYFRDQGLSVALMADSTSRWAEAMREVSARLEEMPGERGYPAYLASKLAEFYERAGRVHPLGQEETTGSVSVIGAVSPPGGDFTEPVTQNTLRVTKVFWALDKNLAHKRHFPAISWTDSYSGYTGTLQNYFEENVAEDWNQLIKECRQLLQQDGKLQETVQLVGKDALPESKQLTLEIAGMVKRFFLQQNAFHDVDTFCPPEKTISTLRTILRFGEHAEHAMENGAALDQITNLEAGKLIAQLKFEENYKDHLEKIDDTMKQEFETLNEQVNA